jgi:hypothetical protein
MSSNNWARISNRKHDYLWFFRIDAHWQLQFSKREHAGWLNTWREQPAARVLMLAALTAPERFDNYRIGR